MKQVRRLAPGAMVGIVGTGSPLSPERLRLGVSDVGSRGYLPFYPLDPSLYYGRYDYGFTNGSPQQRADALMKLVVSDEVNVIIAARGGYGSLDLLPLLDFEQIAAHPKVIVGCSDVTALLLQWVNRAGLAGIHGPTIGSSFADAGTDAAAKRSVDALFALLSEPSARFSVNCRMLRPGVGEGVLIGGNLSMLVALLGTPWDLNYAGKILVVEEVSEAPFRIHRMLTQLRLAGKLDSLAALVFGRFARCSAAHGPTVEQVIDSCLHDILAGSSYPVAADFPFGHWGENQPVPFGCRGQVRDGVVSLLESPVA